VVDSGAVLSWLQSGAGHAAFDTWPAEPHISSALLEATTVASPHVAGYSERGKHIGARAVYTAFCRHFGYTPRPAKAVEPPATLPVPGHQPGTAGPGLSDWLLAACPVRRDDEALRNTLGLTARERARAFDRLRLDYPPRPEFSDFRLPAALPQAESKTLQKLGFCV
jgi:erythronate-4-phosphate dehydrogenase